MSDLAAAPIKKNTPSIAFSVNPKTLEKALSFADSIVSKKSVMPILSHLKINVDESITFTATDMDLAIKETFPANIQHKGEICVLSSLFYDIAKKIGRDEPIQCTLVNNMLFIKTTKSEFYIKTLDASSFADISTLSFDNIFSLKAKDLLMLLDQVHFCMSVDDARYNLNGIYFHQNLENKITCVSTDLHRLAIASLNDSAQFSPCIISAKTVYELQRILQNCEGDVKISVAKARIQFEVESHGIFITLSARLVDGAFPNYQKIIVDDHENKAVISCDLLKIALERIVIVLPEDERFMRFYFRNNQLTLKATSQGLGTAEEQITIDYSGADLDIVFNVDYVFDIARHIKEASLTFLMRGNYDSVVIETPKAVYYIMPVVA